MNPDHLEIDTPGDNEKTTVIGLGEIAVLREPKLSTFKIASFFPAESDPEQYAAFFNKWRAGKREGRFTAQGLGIDMPVAVESFSFDRRAGEEDDIYYEIALTEYRPYGAKVFEIPPDGGDAPPPAPARPDNKPPVAQEYTVKKGDNLWAIARRLSGDGARWRELYEANKTVVGNNPNLIYPGQVFVVPQSWVTA